MSNAERMDFHCSYIYFFVFIYSFTYLFILFIFVFVFSLWKLISFLFVGYVGLLVDVCV